VKTAGRHAGCSSSAASDCWSQRESGAGNPSRLEIAPIIIEALRLSLPQVAQAPAAAPQTGHGPERVGIGLDPTETAEGKAAESGGGVGVVSEGGCRGQVARKKGRVLM